MLLTLEEAATRLGKSTRQVRYLIQQEKLTARKAAGHNRGYWARSEPRWR